MIFCIVVKPWQTQEELEKYVKQGKKSARAINRARILLLANEGKIDDEIINALSVCRTAVYKMRKKFTESRFDTIVELLTENIDVYLLNKSIDDVDKRIEELERKKKELEINENQ